MTTLETQQEQSQFLDCTLYCEETCWDDDDNDRVHDHGYEYGSSVLSPLHEDSSCCEDDEEQLNDLVLKERKQACFGDSSKLVLMEARRDALEWMIRVNSHHNFSVMTLVLGVNYFDRFVMSFGFQTKVPWMIHVAAIACLSLASKVEGTHVPSLLDFQVENKQIFEAKVIQRMELLVLSTLEWKMYAVTPLSYFGHLIRKLNLKPHCHWTILWRCESLVLSSIMDSRFLCYVPSVLAATIMVQTLKEIGLWSNLEHQVDIIDTLKLDKDKVEECYKFIQELSSNEKVHKRKKSYSISANTSPNNVFDLVVSSEGSSKDSSYQPLPKRCRAVGPTCFG